MGALLLSVLIAQLSRPTAEPRVELLRTPEGGIQPRAVADGEGRLHVVGFHGAAAGGTLAYSCSIDGGKSFGKALPIGGKSGHAVALGNVRGTQIALGRGARVHVVWNGIPEGEGHEAPFHYTRLDAADAAFEPERDLAGTHRGLDGGGAVAADGAGNVWVVWHAPPEGTKGEAERRVWVAHSSDDGASFAPALAADEPGWGVCPCCGLGAQATGEGGLSILYRRARDGVRRDTVRIGASTPGGPFRSALVNEWRVPT